MHTRQEILECFVKWLDSYAYRVDRYTITEQTRITRGKLESRMESQAMVKKNGQEILFSSDYYLSELSAQVEREILGQEVLRYDRTLARTHVKFFRYFGTVGQWIDWIEGLQRS